ncbi:MAG: hypothetical protein JWP01_1524 [Myxococcales bacterium]|nr:hypothetical protein [Myxococcales bacterium]
MNRVLVLLVLAAACKQAEPPAPGSEILAKTRALSAQMCACKDKACATPLRASWDELTREISGVTFTADQVEGLATEDQRFMKCMAALDPVP